MGDFGIDSAIEPAGDGFRARLSRDWEIWGPNGGYLAAIALRAAGASSAFRRPASFFCHYLSVAEFDVVTLDVVRLRRAKRAESLRVTMNQGDRTILEAMVWTIDENEGLTHTYGDMPHVPQPEDLPPVEELRRPSDPEFPFWRNFDRRPVGWVYTDDFQPGPPIVRQWIRFRPTAVFDDPFLDAGRGLLLIDTLTWPAAWRHHGPAGYIAPSLDVSCAFHRSLAPHDWVLIDACSPIAGHGLVNANARVWSRQGELLASGGSQLYCRPVPA